MSVDISPRTPAKPTLTRVGTEAESTPPSPAVPDPHADNAQWERNYRHRLLATDFSLIFIVVLGAHLVWFGQDTALTSIKLFGVVDYWFVSVALAVGWLGAMQVSGSRESRVMGTGSREYQLVFNACFAWFGIVAIAATLFKVDIARGYLLIAFPAGVVVLLAGRKFWRSWLVRRRVADGSFSARVMVIGSASAVTTMVRELRRNPDAGYHVVGACIPEGSTLGDDIDTSTLHFGSLETPVDDLRVAGGNTIAVAGGDKLRTRAIRQISWQLHSGVEHLIVSPNLIDIAGPRIHTRPVSGLSLIHVETPRYAGTRRFLKESLDFVGALVLIVVSSPMLLAVAMAVRLSTPGPVFFRQERIGLNGKPFQMLKFRSMVVDAEARLEALIDTERDAGNAIMFKLASDPRVTPVGRWMRRFSIDELPQFFNVLRRDMSLVGPRPPLATEVANYEEDVHRRFLVRPGITGLWQVSGRSNLTWEESVRLDLYYVENWSALGDLQILWRTARAVLARDGAY